MSYQAPPQQLPSAQPPQPSNPPHGAHTLNSGPQPGTAPATQHSQAGPATGQAYGPHSYTEPAKPKKGQQLWNRMKRKSAKPCGGSRGWGPYRAPRCEAYGVCCSLFLGVVIARLGVGLFWTSTCVLGPSSRTCPLLPAFPHPTVSWGPLDVLGKGLTLAFAALTAAPGTGGLKFNIQKRPFAVTTQSFGSNAEGQHGGFGPQPNPEKAQNHR